MRAEVRLFHTTEDLPCQQDPELFFHAPKSQRAIARCADCSFLGRCGYNAVAAGATHGVWGGVLLPGLYTRQLNEIYARLAEQFERRRRMEVGDVAVAALPDLDRDQHGAGGGGRPLPHAGAA
ncbi:hypothetical protein F0Q45_21375, partial [Mycobacterium simiae]